MKECPHCRGRYADAQETCPDCGRKPGDPEGELQGSRDVDLQEGFPPRRKRQLIVIIVFIDILIFAAAIAWFLK